MKVITNFLSRPSITFNISWIIELIIWIRNHDNQLSVFSTLWWWYIPFTTMIMQSITSNQWLLIRQFFFFFFLSATIRLRRDRGRDMGKQKVRGWAEKFIGWLRSCAIALKLGMHKIQPSLILNCIVCFQLNLNWISNSGLWKVVLETFQNSLENWRRTMVLHTSLCGLQWRLCVTVALNWLISDHPPYSSDLAPSDYFMLPNMKKPRLAGKQYRIMRSFCSWGLFFEDQDESFYATGI